MLARRILLFLCVLFAASTALADSWNLSGSMEPGLLYRWTYNAADATGDRVAIDATGCHKISITADIVSGSIEAYLVKTASSSTVSGTSVFSASSSQRLSTSVDPGPFYIRPKIVTQGEGELQIRCYAYVAKRSISNGGGGGGSLATLTDVDLTGVATSDHLCKSAGDWVPCPASAPGAHAATHAAGQGDPVTISSLPGVATDSQINGAAESDEVAMGGDLGGPASNAQIAAGAVDADTDTTHVGDPASWLGIMSAPIGARLDVLADRTRFALASNDFDAIADLNTQTTWRRTKPNGPFTVTSYAGNPCRAFQEAYNYTLSTTSPVDGNYKVGVFGEATVDAADLFDQGTYRGCVFLIPSSAAPGVGGSGGYSVDDANRAGWPEIGTKNNPFSLTNLTVSSATSTSLTDADVPTAFTALTGTNYIETTSGTGSGQVRRISGTPSATQVNVDPAWTVTPDPSTVYKVFSLPGLTGGSVSVHTVDDFHLTIDQTGQTEPWVFMQRGNGYNCGHTINGASETSCGIAQFDFEGLAQIIWSNGVTSTGWLAGEMPEGSAASIITPDRGTVTYFDNGYYRSRDDTRRTVYCESGNTDSVVYYVAQTWGLQRSAKGAIGNCGLGVKYHDNNATTWASQYISAVRYGVSIGDVPNGGDFVVSSLCLSTFCGAVYTGGAGGMTFDDWIMESCDYGCLIHVDGGGEFYSPHGETDPASLIAHQWIVGAVRCDAGNAATEGQYVARSAIGTDCGSGGTGVPHATGPVTQLSFTGKGFSPTSTSTNFAGLIIGDGATQSKGAVSFGPDFEFGLESIAANDPRCTGSQAPLFYCYGVASSPAMVINGPRIASGASSVRIILGNAGHLSAEHGAGTTILWPYNYYKFPDTHTASFACDGCDLNGSDALGRDGGFAPDGSISANTDDFAAAILRPHTFFGAQTFTNVYFTKFSCVLSSYGGWSTGDQVTLRAFLYNGTTSVGIGNGVTFTEGVDPVGVPKANSMNTNSDHFDFSSGSAKSFTGKWSLGMYISSETDAGDDNLFSGRCDPEYATLGDE